MGNVYFIKAKGGKHMKVGYATNVERRITQLQTGNPRRLKVIAVVPGTRQLESAYHQILAPYRAVGEWFCLEGKVRTLLRFLEAGARPADIGSLCALLDFEPEKLWLNEVKGVQRENRERALPHIQKRLAKRGLTFADRMG